MKPRRFRSLTAPLQVSQSTKRCQLTSYPGHPWGTDQLNPGTRLLIWLRATRRLSWNTPTGRPYAWRRSACAEA